jgi:hypothetical protein
MISRIEALADAISACTGYTDPASEEYQCRNPLSLKAYSVKHEKTESGLRMFKNLESGHKAGLFDLTVKCEGDSRARVGKDSSLKELIRCYSMPNQTVDYVVVFLKKALGDETISSETPLHYFVERNGNARS